MHSQINIHDQRSMLEDFFQTDSVGKSAQNLQQTNGYHCAVLVDCTAANSDLITLEQEPNIIRKNCGPS